MDTKQIEKKAQELKELKAMAQELSAEIDAIESEIKAEMDKREVLAIQAGIFNIKYTPVTSDRFDTARFKKTMPEIYRQFTKPSSTRRFTVA